MAVYVRSSKEPPYIYYLFILCALLLIVALALTFSTAEKTQNRNYDMQIEASKKAALAMNRIKKEKLEMGLEMPPEDKLETGLLGPSFTNLTTTSGDPKSKRTSTNPNFAAVFIEMFKEAGLKKGDEVAIVLSGSFPALNISALAAAEVYNLKTCVMASIGASSYGANQPELTFFDMANLLYDEGYLKKKVDYVSYGGSNDDGKEFDTEIFNLIQTKIDKRVSEGKVKFLRESNFKLNIEERINIIFEDVPNIKLLLNVGGNLVSMGEGMDAAVTYRGLVKPNYLNSNKNQKGDGIGLLDSFLNLGIPVIQMLNMKGLALDYGLEYDPSKMPEIGVGDVYYETTYNLMIPVISLVLTTGLLVSYAIYRFKKQRRML